MDILKDKEISSDLHAKYSGLDVSETLKDLNTSLNGISEREAEDRLEKFGFNEPAKKKRYHIVVKFLMNFLNPLIIILMVIDVLSLFFGEKISAIFISAMILISVSLSFIQENGSQKAIEKLRNLVKTRILVTRSGKQREIDIKDVVPGDIVHLYVGDVVPADLRIISSQSLFVNQSTLTGESIPSEKISFAIKLNGNSITDLNNIAFMGSSIVSGSGVGVVVSTGLSTAFGEISKTLVKDKEKTSFDIGIKKFTLLLIRFTIILVIAIFFINFVFKSGTFREALLFSLAVAVGLTPEMLPTIVTINLSKGARAMAQKKVIVKHLDSIQNFGAMDVLCTDKTGTLTENKITLERYCDVNGKESERVFNYTYLNSYHQTGIKNLIEKAILDRKKISVSQYKKIGEIPYDYSRKIISIAVEDKNTNRKIVISKGAPEEIFKRCGEYETSGRVMKINESVFVKLKKEYEKLSNEGFIVIAVAYKELGKGKSKISKEDEKNLVLIGYLAFLDPPKHSVREIITSLKNLGIEMKVLTGDNDVITRRICQDVGFEIKGVLTGDEIDRLSESEIKEAVEKINIFTRLSPIQKKRVIDALRLNKHVVGYLGDGMNDAPALRAADVGISVNNAVEIARESADVILLEKNLLVLKEGILEGRMTFGNIVKYLKMGSSSNFGNMLSFSGAVIFVPFLPMLPIQILFNNFLYDLSQISLPVDRVDKEYLTKPRTWNIKFLEKFMLFIGPLSSIFDFIIFGIMFFVFNATTAASASIFQTGWFIESMVTQILVMFVIRTNKIPFLESKPHKLFVLSSVLILIVAIGATLSSFGKFFGFTPLPFVYFVILFLMTIVYLVLVQIVKSWVVKKYGYQ
ncbi:MAG: magnesium-translocating P-type ATPase [Nanoarchaeota archaeon]